MDGSMKRPAKTVQEDATGIWEIKDCQFKLHSIPFDRHSILTAVAISPIACETAYTSIPITDHATSAPPGPAWAIVAVGVKIG
jgi:hypothetical protein